MSFTLHRADLSADDPEQLPDESEFDDDDPDRAPDEEPDGEPDPGLAEQRTRIAIRG